MISHAGSFYARTALGLAQRDATSGFRAYRAEALRLIDVDAIASEGYSFQIEILWVALRCGLAVAEVPITFTDRTLGHSKMSGRIVVEALLRVTGWGLAGLPERWTRAHAQRLTPRRRGAVHV